MNEQDEILKQEANISKIDMVALLFKYKKTIQQQKQNECAKLLKKIVEWNSSNFKFPFFWIQAKSTPHTHIFLNSSLFLLLWVIK